MPIKTSMFQSTNLKRTISSTHAATYPLVSSSSIPPAIQNLTILSNAAKLEVNFRAHASMKTLYKFSKLNDSLFWPPQVHKILTYRSFYDKRNSAPTFQIHFFYDTVFRNVIQVSNIFRKLMSFLDHMFPLLVSSKVINLITSGSTFLELFLLHFFSTNNLNSSRMIRFKKFSMLLRSLVNMNDQQPSMKITSSQNSFI